MWPLPHVRGSPFQHTSHNTPASPSFSNNNRERSCCSAKQLPKFWTSTAMLLLNDLTHGKQAFFVFLALLTVISQFLFENCTWLLSKSVMETLLLLCKKSSGFLSPTTITETRIWLTFCVKWNEIVQILICNATTTPQNISYADIPKTCGTCLCRKWEILPSLLFFFFAFCSLHTASTFWQNVVSLPTTDAIRISVKKLNLINQTNSHRYLLQ